MRRRLIVSIVLVLILAGCSKPEPTAEGEPVADPAPQAAAPAPPTPEGATAPGPGDPEKFAVAHEYTRMFYGGEIDLLHGKFSDEMREVIPLDKLSALYEHSITAYGRETRVIGEESDTSDEYRAFVRWAQFDKTADIIEIQWILREDDSIAGFYIKPAARRVRSEGQVALDPS